MLLLTRESARWRWIAVVLLALATGAYLIYRARSFPHGGSWPGLAFGILGLALVLLMLFFAVRKRMYRSRLGHLESWLQSHVWLGLLSVPVVLFHAGFRFEDAVAVAAFVLLALVVATGLVGAVLYTAVPRLLTEVESNVPPEWISEELNQLARAMERLARGKSAPFRRLCQHLLEVGRPPRRAGWRILVGRPPKVRAPLPAGIAERLRQVAPDEQEELEELLALSRQHRELHQRLVLARRYQNYLEVWLYAHVPLSLALLIVLLVHVGAALYYRGLF